MDDRLLALLLDPQDTAVTLRTAAALLERRDPRAMRLIIRASAEADDNTNDWIGGALANFRAESLGADDDFLRSALAGFADGDDEACARAAREWAAWLRLGDG